MNNIREYNAILITALGQMESKLELEIEDIDYQLENTERCEDFPFWRKSACRARHIKHNQKHEIGKSMRKRAHIMSQYKPSKNTSKKIDLVGKQIKLKEKVKTLNKAAFNHKQDMKVYRKSVAAEYEKMRVRDKEFISLVRVYLVSQMGKDKARELFTEIGVKVNASNL